MGTHSLIGFFYRGRYYVVYCHWDGYPEGVGTDVVREIMAADLDRWRAALDCVRVIPVGGGEKPTAGDIERLAPHADPAAHAEALVCDWDGLLTHCQGSIERVLSSGYLLNHVDDQGIPFWEEYGYAYIVDLDANRLQFFEGLIQKGSYDLQTVKRQGLWGCSKPASTDATQTRSPSELLDRLAQSLHTGVQICEQLKALCAQGSHEGGNDAAGECGDIV